MRISRFRWQRRRCSKRILEIRRRSDLKFDLVREILISTYQRPFYRFRTPQYIQSLRSVSACLQHLFYNTLLHHPNMRPKTTKHIIDSPSLRRCCLRHCDHLSLILSDFWTMTTYEARQKVLLPRHGELEPSIELRERDIAIISLPRLSFTRPFRNNLCLQHEHLERRIEES